MFKQFKLVIGAALTATLVACGGGGDSGTTASSTTPTPTPSPTAFTVGGTVYGLNTGAQLTLKNANEQLTINKNGVFLFLQTIGRYDSYAVSVNTQPAGQYCTVTNGFGNGSAQTNISNITVSCVAGNYTSGGVVTGLLPGATLDVNLNSGASVKVGNGPFSFDTLLPIFSPATIAVVKQPLNGQVCAITQNTTTSLTANLTANIGCTPYVLSSLTINGLPPTGVTLTAGGFAASFSVSGKYSDGSEFSTGNYSVVNGNPRVGVIPEYEVKISDQSVIQLSVGGFPVMQQIRPIKAGTSTVTISYGPISVQSVITVNPNSGPFVPTL
jgi:hypothetical protein